VPRLGRISHGGGRIEQAHMRPTTSQAAGSAMAVQRWGQADVLGTVAPA